MCLQTRQVLTGRRRRWLFARSFDLFHDEVGQTPSRFEMAGWNVAVEKCVVRLVDFLCRAEA